MIKSNLISSLKGSEGWTAFAEALQKTSDSFLEPVLDRLQRLTSVFTMHPDDLQIRLDEAGAYFSIGKVEREDVPLLLQQRLDEIHAKNYLYPLEKTFKREFSDVTMSWQPLYAPKDLEKYPYGSRFLMMRDIERDHLDPKDFFMTKRGVVFANLNEARSSMSIEDFEALLTRVALPLIPVHIAFDGQQYYFEAIMTQPEYILNMVSSKLSSMAKIVDTTKYNSNIESMIRESHSVTAVPFVHHKKILIDDHPFDYLSIDTNFTEGN